MKTLYYICILLIGTLCAPVLSQAATVPRAAETIARQIDEQLMRRIGNSEGGRAQVDLVATVAADLSNLNETSPLSRQMTEEVVACLIGMGYRVHELRKGKEITMDSVKGEKILTRNTGKITQSKARTVAVLAGTYTMTTENVRFNMRLLSTPSNEVLAMGSATVGISEELQPLLTDRNPKAMPKPTVFTRLP